LIYGGFSLKFQGMVTKEKIIEALSRILPVENITGVVVNGGKVGFALESMDENLRKTAEKAVFAISGVEKVTAVLTGKQGNIVVEKTDAAVLNRKQPIAGVKKIIAIGSGKGGVGKSTVTVNLAAAMAEKGLRVGIADADIYGPSIARMLGTNQKPQLEGEFMLPVTAHGIQFSSMALLIGENDAAIWRGPMATKALHQLLRGVKWDNLDVLLIDMPPGTGDIHLSIAQHYPLAGAVLVSTPQEIALLDVKKAAAMFARVEVPILGIVENMSYFIDPASNNKTHIFGKGGVKKFADEIGIRFLGEVPIHTRLRENADAGTPEVHDEFNNIVGVIL
jgi:ATP-binding protein involved in chromosome partitioning